MVNLLDETLEKIKANGKSIEEIKFVMAETVRVKNGMTYPFEEYMNWEDFAEQADKIYDDGYGGNEVKMGLKIIGKNWWLERHEYDGAEWWEFKQIPKKPKKYNKFNPFVKDGEY